MKTQLLTSVVLLLVTLTSTAQNNVGIGTTTPHPKALLELQATDKGLLVPRLSNAQMLAITTPPNGLLVYNTTQNCFNYYNTTTVAWKSMCSTTGITNSGDTVIINLLKADSIFANYLTVNSAFITNLFATTIKADTGYIKNIISQYLKADSAYIKLLRTDSLIIKGVSIDSLIKQITTNYLNSKDTVVLNYLRADSIYTTLIRADSAFINYLHANTIKADTIVGGVGNFTTLNVGGIPINQLITDSITAQAWLLKGNNASSANKLGTLNSRDLHIVAGNATDPDRITILNGTGNVGIGQTLPSEKLDVIGNIKTTGSVEFGTTLKPAGLTGTTGDILISQGALLAPTWVAQSSIVPTTTNTLANPTNTITSTVNGVVATSPAVNTVANSLTGTNLTTTVNGVAGTPVDLSTIIPPSNNWSLLGNAGTTAGTNFLGTTDNMDLVFKRNNVQAGLIGTLGNTSFGELALNPLNTGAGNTAIGYNSLGQNTTGVQNTGVGVAALRAHTTGVNNTAVGYQSMFTNATGIANTSLGAYALNLATGNSNTALGAQALQNTSTGQNNTAVGAFSISTNTTGSSNAAYGVNSLSTNTTGSNNAAYGLGSLFANTTGNDNVAIGNSAISYIVNNTTDPNTAVGTNALYGGDNSIFANNTANGNVAIGYNAMYGTASTPSTGTSNVAVGNNSLNKNTSGSYNVATGNYALRLNTTGYDNSAGGYLSLSANTIGSGNTAFGKSSLQNNTGDENTAVGNSSLAFAIANNNSALGSGSLSSTITGTENTALGFIAGNVNTIGNDNTFIGARSNATLNNLTRATAIGYNAKVGASNAMVLGGTGVDTINVGIGTPTPNTKALLDMVSTSKGLLMPRVTTAQRLAINNNAVDATIVGLQVYDTDTKTFWYHDGTFWVQTANNPDPTVASITVFPFVAIPADYLECNGAAISRTTYAALFIKLGTTYGVGNGSTTFNLPDLRGEFVRGFDNGRGADAARVIGSAQAATGIDDQVFQTVILSHDNQDGANYNATAVNSGPGQAGFGRTINRFKVRPRNVAMVYAIKAIPTTVTVGATTINNIVNTAVAAAVPAGLVQHFANITAPVGYLECNGSAVSRTTYAALFAAIGTLYGVGDGSTTFNVPDLRGEFIRGADNGRGVDAARVLGSAQADALKSHTHDYQFKGGNAASGVDQWNGIAGRLGTNIGTSATGGLETRPRNVAMMPCIKY